LLARLVSVENQLEQIEQYKAIGYEATRDQIQDYVTRNVLQLQNLAAADPTRAKVTLRRHVKHWC